LINIEESELENEALHTTLIAATYEAWKTWCNGRPMPSWNDVEMMDLPLSLIPYTVVLDVQTEPLDFVYRFWGSGLAAHHNQELTGCSVDDVRPVEISRIARRNYVELASRANPIFTVNRYMQDDGSLMDDYIVRLPFSDDGKEVNKVMSVVETPDKSHAYLNGINQLFPSNT
jgi:hypothetical protein